MFMWSLATIQKQLKICILLIPVLIHRALVWLQTPQGSGSTENATPKIKRSVSRLSLSRRHILKISTDKNHTATAVTTNPGASNVIRKGPLSPVQISPSPDKKTKHYSRGA
ncbi:hypothetical protein GDO86_005398 [Hymenochirus boettgeri]|uniref:Uncharacterized protein n=1 Tax=Hymenochirus boettgeri TaxID=247094 RepID=A0A8T2J6S8_9PIPI|nr:hypothetical protein GDO86_005398 [Hymenochirus boettgeri]